MEPYGINRIASEIDATANGSAYHGNSLYVAKEIPGLTADDRSVLDRYLTGKNTPSDRFRLQDIAIKIRSLDDSSAQSELERLAGCRFPSSNNIAVVEIGGAKWATSPVVAGEVNALREKVKALSKRIGCGCGGDYGLCDECLSALENK